MEAPITVAEAVLQIQDSSFLLPAVQRDLAWNADRMETLFDSLLRGYPVGSFLFWKVRPENSQKYRFYDFMRSYDAANNKRLKHHDIVEPRQLTCVLDGQQRLTSFAIGLLGHRADKVKWKWSSSKHAYPKRKLYLNLTAEHTPEDELDRMYDFRFLTDEEVTADAEVHWFPVRDVLTFRQGTGDVNTYKLMQYTVNKKLNEWGAGALANLVDRICKAQVIHFFQEDEQSLSRVLDVFVRLNSGGIPLSYSDLLLSIASAQWKNDARDAIYGVVDEINDIGDFTDAFDKDFVLKSALVLTDLPEIGFSVENFDRKNTEAIESGWEKNVRVPLARAVAAADALGYNVKTLTSANVLIPIAYYLRKIGSPSDFTTHPKYTDDRKAVQRWLVAALLKGAFSAKTDTLISAVRAAIKGAAGTAFPLVAIEKALLDHGVSLKFSDEEIDALLDSQYGHRNTFSVLAALYPSLSYQFRFHVDHAYPKSKARKPYLRSCGLSDEQIEAVQANINSVSNLQLLEGVANQSKQDTDLDEWLKPLKKKPQEWADYQERNAFPPVSSHGWGDFKTFFDARRSLLRKRLAAALSWAESDKAHAPPHKRGRKGITQSS